MVTVTVSMAMPGGITIHIDLGPRLSRPMGARAGIGTLSWTTGTPTMPNIITLGTVMDEDEEAKGDREGTVKAAEDHVQEVAL